MRKIKFLFALLFLPLLIPSVKGYGKGEQMIGTGTYESNIPSVCYDGKTSGYNPNSTKQKLAYDLVDVGGEINYAKLGYIPVAVGETTSLVYEVMFYDWADDFYLPGPMYKIFGADTNNPADYWEYASVTITQGDVTRFDSTNPSAYSDGNFGVDKDSSYGVTLYESNGDGGFKIKEDVVFPTYNFTGIQEGITFFDFSCTNCQSGGSGYSLYLPIFVYDPNTTSRDFFDISLTLENDKTDTSSIDLFSKDYLVCNLDDGYYNYNIEGTKTLFETNGSIYHDVKITADNSCVSIDEAFNKIKFNSAGKVKLTFENTINISFSEKISDATYTPRLTSSIQKFDVYLYIYDTDDIVISNNYQNEAYFDSESNNQLGITLPSYLEEISGYFDTFIGTAVDDDSLDTIQVEEGNYIRPAYLFGIYRVNVTCEITDKILESLGNANIDSNFTVTRPFYVFDPNEDIVDITTNVEEIVFSYTMLDESGYAEGMVTITNYDKISKFATIQVNSLSTVPVSYEQYSGKYYFSYESTSFKDVTGTIAFVATYFNGTTKTKILSFVSVNLSANNMELSTNTLTFTIGKNRTEYISLGENKNGSFITYDNTVATLQVIAPSYIEWGETEGFAQIWVKLVNGYSTSIVGAISLIVYDASENIHAFTVDVIVQNELEIKSSNFNFEQGKVMSIYLGTQAKLSIGSPYDSFGANYSWYSLDSNVKINKISANEVLLTGLKSCETVVMAIFTTASGNTLSGSIKIYVLDELPQVGISVKASGENQAALNIYQLLDISFSSKGFAFSNDLSLSWYLDGQALEMGLNSQEQPVIINNSTKQFYLKLTEGTHELRLTVIDNEFDIEASGSQSVSIVAVTDQERTLSLSHNGTVYAIVDGDDFKIDALIDGFINVDYTYTWNILDQTIASISMDSNTSALIKPMSIGKTRLIVTVDIGVYESKILREEISIEVFQINSIKIEANSDFYKPGNDGVFTIKYNGYDNVVNGTPNITVKMGKNLIPFEVKENKIIIDSLEKGAYDINLSYKGVDANKEYTVSNFNIRSFIRSSIPYLAICATIIIIIMVIINLRKNPLVKISEIMDSLIAKIDDTCEKTIERNKISKKIVKSINRKFRHLEAVINHSCDNGYDELGSLLEKITITKNILIATIKTMNNDVNYKKIVLILKNVKKNNILVIKEEFDELKTSREKFDALSKEASNAIDISQITSKHKMTKEEYDLYLKNTHYVDDFQDDGDD